MGYIEARRYKVRAARASWRRARTADRYYGMDHDEIEDAWEQIRGSRSAFIVRFGDLKVHKIMTGIGTGYAAYDDSIKEISFFIPQEEGRRLVRLVRRNFDKQFGTKAGRRQLIFPATQHDMESESPEARGRAYVRKDLKKRMEVLQTMMDHIMRSGAIGEAGGAERIGSLSNQYDVLKDEHGRLLAKDAPATRKLAPQIRKLAPPRPSALQRDKDREDITQILRHIQWMMKSSDTNAVGVDRDRYLALLDELSSARSQYRTDYGHSPESVSTGEFGDPLHPIH